MNDYFGKHTTPKLMAESILMNQICAKLEFIGDDDQIAHMTRRERKLIYTQSVKIAKRLAKVLRYEPDSFPWSDYPV